MSLRNSLDPRTEEGAVAHGDLEVRDQTERCWKFPEWGRGAMPQCCEPPGQKGGSLAE